MFFGPNTRGGFRGTVPTPLVPTAIHTLKVHFTSRLCRQRTTGETSNRWQVTTWRRSRAAAESLEWPVFNDAFFFLHGITYCAQPADDIAICGTRLSECPLQRAESPLRPSINLLISTLGHWMLRSELPEARGKK